MEERRNTHTTKREFLDKKRLRRQGKKAELERLFKIHRMKKFILLRAERWGGGEV